jgi:galacturan 1,4-alpha-galacturonidase
MIDGLYFKTWTDTIHGSPPNGGGAGGGYVKNITARNFKLDRVQYPVRLYQTNLGEPGDAPSRLHIGDVNFENWSGTGNTSTSE